MQMYKKQYKKSNHHIQYSTAAVITEKKRTVSVTEEPEIMSECIFINSMPVTIHESGNKQQQSTLRLMEIGNQYIHYTELVARNNDYSRSDLKFIEPVLLKIYFNRHDARG